MRVETPGGTMFRLTYGTETGGRPAVGFDRSRLDPRAARRSRAAAGAEVRRRLDASRDVEPAAGTLEMRDPDGTVGVVHAAVVVGADGPHSVVARAAGVARPARLAPRIGLTYHLADDDPGPGRSATPGCASCATATSGSRRCRAAG